MLFEDIIDGYFPLCESLRQMLVRRGLAAACVTIQHAPIMNIPNLAPDAPVPLQLGKGTAGLIGRLDITVVLNGAEPQLTGQGIWRWYVSDTTPAKTLSPLTRLAEPAIINGIGFTAGNTPSDCFGLVTEQTSSDFSISQNEVFFSRDPSLTNPWSGFPEGDGIRVRYKVPK